MNSKLRKSRFLANGAEVLLRPVPPHIQVQIGNVVQNSVPSAPEPPRVQWETADGRLESVPAGPGDSEYQEWVIERDEWAREYGPVIDKLHYTLSAAQYDYKVVGWRMPGITGFILRAIGKWSTNPPLPWSVPSIGGLVDVSTGVNKRADYIMTELIQDIGDYETINSAFREVEEVVTKEEVEAYASSFPADDRRRHRPTDIREEDAGPADDPGECLCGKPNDTCGGEGCNCAEQNNG